MEGSVFIYSSRCEPSMDIIKLFKEYPVLQTGVSFYDVLQQRGLHGLHPIVAQNVKSLPSMVTRDGKLYVGNAQIKGLLQRYLPEDPIQQYQPYNYTTAIDGRDDSDNLFNVNQYGMDRASQLTPEMQRRIMTNVSSANVQYTPNI